MILVVIKVSSNSTSSSRRSSNTNHANDTEPKRDVIAIVTTVTIMIASAILGITTICITTMIATSQVLSVGPPSRYGP